MAYLLEDITQSDISQIMLDIGPDEGRIKLIEYGLNDGSFSKKWAINRDINSYLFMSPDIVMDGCACCKHMFFFENRFYDLTFGDLFGSILKIKADIDFGEVALNALQKSIIEGFSVYGRYGDGILNSVGQPAYKVVPVFNNECL